MMSEFLIVIVPTGVIMSMVMMLFLFVRSLEHIRVLRDDSAKLKRIAFEQHQEIVKLQESMS